MYADHETPGGSQDTLPLLEPITEDVEQDSSATYGASKVGCEIDVQTRAHEWLVIRPGLIAGPGDPSGRFGYWPRRLAEGGQVLAPGSAERPAQLIDVRDLAAWVVSGAEQRLTGVFDATGRVTTVGVVLDEVARRVGGGAELVWADESFLEGQDVRHWSGPRSLPLWLPEECTGMVSHDVSAAHAAGLTTRDIAETAADTLAWVLGRIPTLRPRGSAAPRSSRCSTPGTPPRPDRPGVGSPARPGG